MLLTVDGLTKRHGADVAVQAVSFSLDVGDVVALIGLNGAGKSSAMRMLAGVMEPDAGAIRLESIDMLQQRRRAQARIGFLPEGAPLYDAMSVAGHLDFFARAHGLTASRARYAVNRLAAEADLGARLDRPIAALSKGERRRLALATACIHDPALLLLDEPMDGLDAVERDGVRAMIARVAVGRGVLLSTPTIEDAEALCTRAVVLHAGAVAADASVAALIAQHGALDAAFRAVIGAAETVAA